MAKDLDKRKSELKAEYDDAKQFFIQNYATKYALYKNAYDGVVQRGSLAPWRSAINIPLAFTAVQTQLVRAKKGIFNNGNFWGLQPIHSGKEVDIQRDAYGLLLGKQSEQMHWTAEEHAVLEDMLKVGTGWMRVLWEREEASKEYFDEEDGKIVTKKEDTVLRDGNQLKRLDPTKVFPDPTATTYWDAEYVCEELDIKVSSIKKNRKRYNETSEVNRLLADLDNKDDMKSKKVVKAVRIWRKDGVAMLVEGEYLIQDSLLPFKHAMIPIVPFICYPDAGHIRGKGIIEIIYDMVGYQNKVYNLKADNLVLSILKLFIKKKSARIGAQQLDLYPGKVIELDDPNTDLLVKDLGTVNPQIFVELRDLQGYVNQAIGNLDYINAPTGIGAVNKTAKGAEIIVAEANMRFADNIIYNKENAVVPIVQMITENTQHFLGAKEALKMLTEEEVKSLGLEGKAIDTSLKMKYMAVGNSSLETNQQKVDKILQTLPILAQMPGGMEKVNVEGLVDYFLESVDFPSHLINKGKPEDKKTPGQTPVDKNKLKEMVIQIVKQTGANPESVIKDLTTGMTPEAILAKYSKSNAPVAPINTPEAPVPPAPTQN